jgi:hypothetical protein
MDPMYDFRLLHLRTLRYLVDRELGNGADQEGVQIRRELDLAIATEEADREVGELLLKHGAGALDERLKALAEARDAEEQPVHDGFVKNDDEAAEAETKDARCVRCGIDMIVTYPSDGPTPLPICDGCHERE